MTTGDSAFAGSIPALYHRFMGPMLFQPYADDLASRLAGLTGGHLLETASGTGIVTQALIASLPAAVEIVATDLNQAMSTSRRPGPTWRAPPCGRPMRWPCPSPTAASMPSSASSA